MCHERDIIRRRVEAPRVWFAHGCTGEPAGIGMDIPAWRTPDGCSFQPEHNLVESWLWDWPYQLCFLPGKSQEISLKLLMDTKALFILGNQNKEKQRNGDYLLEALPAFGEVCVWERQSAWVWEHANTGIREHICMFRTSNVAASDIFPACLYMIKPQLEVVSYITSGYFNLAALLTSQHLCIPQHLASFLDFLHCSKTVLGFLCARFWCFGSFHPQLGVTHSPSMCQFPPIEHTWC